MPPRHQSKLLLSDENDVKDLLKGIRFVQKLVNTSALGKIGGFLSAKNAKCSYKFDTDKFWEWYIRHATWSLSPLRWNMQDGLRWRMRWLWWTQGCG